MMTTLNVSAVVSMGLTPMKPQTRVARRASAPSLARKFRTMYSPFRVIFALESHRLMPSRASPPSTRRAASRLPPLRKRAYAELAPGASKARGSERVSSTRGAFGSRLVQY